MAIINEENALFDTVLQVAKAMVTAAVTAPKAKGISNLHTAIVYASDMYPIIDKMESMSKEFDLPSFYRDAQNLKNSDVIVFLATTLAPIQLKKCGLCGFVNCAEKSKFPKVPCVFNTGDLGIAVGSAVSVAMDNRVDNRIMYSAGLAAVELGIFSKDVAVAYAIPLKASKKNIFFDRN